MGTRILAGVIGLALLLPSIIWGGIPAVLIIVSLALLICQEEYATMAFPEARNLGRLLLPLGLAVFFSAVLAPATALIPVLSVSVMVALVVPMLRTEDVNLATQQAIRMVFGLIYVPILLAPLVWIRRESDGLWLVILLMAITWLGDTGAYFAGRFTGKTPLFPRVSPKKTREGLVGGILLAVVGALAIKATGTIDLPWWTVALLGLVLDIAGVLGDLAESLLKRAFGVKDSGWIMPGHGGLLDRVDSLLFSGPLLYTCLLVRGAETVHIY
jgi:phosphatidate cytidylyltransferase